MGLSSVRFGHYFDCGCSGDCFAAEDMDLALDAVSRFRLDFDDAYQYAIAGKHELTIVSFDGDFDRTALGRRLPADIASA